MSWLQVLKASAESIGGRQTAKLIGYSGALVSQVLSGTYKGDLTRVQRAVEGALMKHEVDCPIVGEIPQQRCIEHQRRPQSQSLVNPAFVQIYHACRNGCPHSLLNHVASDHKENP